MKRAMVVAALLTVAWMPAKADSVTTVTFTQPESQYASLGVTFQNVYNAVDPRILQDGHGIAQGTGNLFTETSPISTILFTNPVSDLSLTWFSLDSQFIGSAYDTKGNLVFGFQIPVCENYAVFPYVSCEGTVDLSGFDIAYFQWYGVNRWPGQNDFGLTGIDSLSFVDPPSVVTPEPDTFWLLGFGLVGLLALKKKFWHLVQ